MNGKYTVKWSAIAEDDVLGIVSYITAHSGPTIAGNIYKRLKSRVEPLEDFPESGRVVPQLAAIGITDIRQITEKPWIIYYKVIEKEIWILAVIDGRRNLEEIIYAKVVEGRRV
jgi:plasmid stabilization system protein ParE